MADTARKKAPNLDKTTRVEKVDQDKPKELRPSEHVVKSSVTKPPLPPRPAGLSTKMSPKKKKSPAPSKKPPPAKQTVKTTKEPSNETFSRPIRLPAPSQLESVKTQAAKGKVVAAKETNEIGSPEIPQLSAEDETSKYINVHEEQSELPPDTPQVLGTNKKINTIESSSEVQQELTEIQSNNAEMSQDSENIAEKKTITRNVAQPEIPEPHSGRSSVSLITPEQPHSAVTKDVTNSCETFSVKSSDRISKMNVSSSEVLSQEVTCATPEQPVLDSLKSSEDVTTATPERPLRVAKTSSAATCEEKSDSSSQDINSTPERPTPSRVARSSSTSQDKMAITSTPERPPRPAQIPRTYKIAPPIPTKPQSPRAEKKSKSMNAAERTSPPVETKTPKSQRPARPKCPEKPPQKVADNSRMETLSNVTPNECETSEKDDLKEKRLEVVETLREVTRESEVFKENNLEGGKYFHVEASIDEAVLSYSVEDTSTERQPTEDINAVPCKDVLPKLTTAGVKGESESKKEKPSRPCAPSRKTDEKTLESQSTDSLNQTVESINSETASKSSKPSRPSKPKLPAQLSMKGPKASNKLDGREGKSTNEEVKHEENTSTASTKSCSKPPESSDQEFSAPEDGKPFERKTEKVQVTQNNFESLASSKPVRPLESASIETPSKSSQPSRLSKPKLPAQLSIIDHEASSKDERERISTTERVKHKENSSMASIEPCSKPPDQEFSPPEGGKPFEGKTEKVQVTQNVSELLASSKPVQPLESIKSPKPSRPSKPKLPAQLSMKDEETNKDQIEQESRSTTEEVKHEDGVESKNRTVQVKQNISDSFESIRQVQPIESANIEAVNITVTKTESTGKPSRPAKPRFPNQSPNNIKDVENNDDKSLTETHQSIKKISSPKPIRPSMPKIDHKSPKSKLSRPSRPLHPDKAGFDCSQSKIEESSKSKHEPSKTGEEETDLYDETVGKVESCQINQEQTIEQKITSITDHEAMIVPIKPERSLKLLHATIKQEDDILQEKNTPITEREASITVVKPERPSKPLHPGQTTADAKETSKQENDISQQKRTSVNGREVPIVKPERPLKPHHCSEQTTAEPKETTEKMYDIVQQKKTSEHEVPKTSVKPERPSKPKLSCELRKTEGEAELEDDVFHQKKTPELEASMTVAKPERPSKPKLSCELKKTEREVEEDEILHQKKISEHEASKTVAKPERPSKPKLSCELKNLEETIIEKHEDEPSKSVHKPSRPAKPNPSKTDNNESDKTIFPAKSCRSADMTLTPENRSKPTRPNAPARDKQMSTANEIPAKPKRTFVSESKDIQQSQQSGETKMLENPPKPPRDSEKNDEYLNGKTSNELHSSSDAKDNELTSTSESCNVKSLEDDSCKDRDSHSVKQSPLSRTTSSIKNGESQDVPHITVTKREKQETTEPDKPSDRHSVKFRVSSLSKTDVESFNEKDFVERLKGKTKPDEDSAKPSRPRPPSNSKRTETSTRHDDKGGSGVTAGGKLEEKTEFCKDENISECGDDLSVKLTEKKIKRKAPPVPTEEQLKSEVEEDACLVNKVLDEKKNEKLRDCVAVEISDPAGDDEDQKEKAQVFLEKSDSEAIHSTQNDTVIPRDDVESSELIKQSTEKENTIVKPSVKVENKNAPKKEHQDFGEHETRVVVPSSSMDNVVALDKSAICDEVTVKNVLTQEICDSSSISCEAAQVTQLSCTESSPIKQEVVRNESSKKKKTPPPKPKRTSSLKMDSKLIVKKVNSVEEHEESSSHEELDDITEEAAKPICTPVSTQDNKKSSSEKVVDADTQELRSKVVFRSTSFASHQKQRAKEPGTKDSEGVTRSLSFGGKMMRKHQPSRPSPPTFFLTETKIDVSENPELCSKEKRKDNVTKKQKNDDVFEQQKGNNVIEERKNDDVIEKQNNDDVILAEDMSTSQEDLVESDAKHDSCLTTDSESENEKQDEPQKSKTYYISREILTTERTFVDAVKLVSEDFREAVNEGNKRFGRAIIPDEILHDIVLNISQIYKFDREFLKALELRMEKWEEEQRIGDIIKRFSPFLKMYKTYIQGYDNAMTILTDALKKYPQFAEVVREFECSERCQNLTVGMYMLKPIQRIPSYRLLLVDYLKHLSNDSLDHQDVSDALDIVSEVATHINEDMKRVDNFEEVLKVQRSLVGQIEIVKPGRELIKEGALMKLCRKDMQSRMFYLFTDVLLYTTPVANNQFRLNLSLPLEEIKVELPVSPDFDNEFSIISTKKSFTLSASTADERDEWFEALRNASDEIRKKKITFHLAKKEKMEALYETQEQENNKELGSVAPVWIPDARVTMCMVCTDDFTVMTNRRHHCRACGKVICGSCSSNSAPLAYLNFETARVCDVCYDELTNKASSAPNPVETQQNGVTSERKDSVPKISPMKKSKKHLKFKSKEVPAVEESIISGYLRTRVGKKWHKRWYVLKDNVLYASKASSDVAAQETRPLLGYEIRGPEKMNGDSKKIVFQLIHAGTEPVVLETDNMKSAERWVNALRRATILPL